MTKLKKQVSKKKILHFFKKNRCVLFFHYDGDTKLYSNFIKQKLCSQFQLNSLFVKNKLADMFLADLSLLYQPKNTNQLNQIPGKTKEKADILLENTAKFTFVKQEQDKQYIRQNKILFKHTLFQGPTILLGFENLENMQKVYNLCKNEKFILRIAAFYDMTILNHLQVERLVKLSNDAFLYSKLLKTSKQPLHHLINISKNSFNLSLLYFLKLQAFTLLKARLYQLSEKKVLSVNNTSE